LFPGATFSIISIDAEFDETGWHFDVFYRKFKKTEYPEMGSNVLEMCRKHGISGRIKDAEESHKVRLEKDFGFNVQVIDVIAYLVERLKK